MADFCVRWGDDVQPYVMQLASDHIETLREYCEEKIARILKTRKRKRRVLAVTSRVNNGMLKARAFHRFNMFGFDFELRENLKTKLGKREFVLHFTTPPAFKPEDMPPRLRRVEGEPLSAEPKKKKRSKHSARKRTKGGKHAKPKKKRGAERVLYRLRPIFKGIAARGAMVASSVTAKLYKMYELNRRLSRQVVVMWRRRPTLGLSQASFLTFAREPEHAPVRARLEPRLIGESIRMLVFTLVSRESTALWDVSLSANCPMKASE